MCSASAIQFNVNLGLETFTAVARLHTVGDSAECSRLLKIHIRLVIQDQMAVSPGRDIDRAHSELIPATSAASHQLTSAHRIPSHCVVGS